MESLDKCEAKWLAGLIDCDGFVSLTKQSKERKTYRIVLCFTNSNRKIVEIAAKLLDVSVVKASNIAWKKPQFRATLTDCDKLKIRLKDILPHLVIKKDKAEFLLEVLDELSYGNKTYLAEYYDKFTELFR